ncbi:MAG: Rdx family protein [Acidobacteriaceae bacterium]|nr:Rdx family protein [Acidobacteriaceae bacterium]MBV9294052.1 Rdx family protein [Acidobacteriaceae bacterium]MBV9766134.1 Rdx family protein [Acidobacteriaceae bacterium]
MSLKNNVERELGIPVRVRTGAPGSFRVLVDGEQIYSIKEAGHSPNPAEIIRLIRRNASL